MSYTNPKSALNLAILNFVLQCSATKPVNAISSMKIGAEDLRDLMDMTGEDMACFAMISDPLFTIELNSETWQKHKRGLRAYAANRKLRNDLIVAGAPRAMIQQWWPMRHADFALLRRMFGVTVLGRTRAPTEEEEHRLWHVWKTIVADRPVDLLRARDYLDLFNRTKTDLRVSWPLTNRWASEGFIAAKSRQVGT